MTGGACSGRRDSGVGQRISRLCAYGTGGQITNTWNWDALNGTGQLESRSSPGFTETYAYRVADGKLQSVVTAINVTGVHSGNYTRTFGYDTQGRLSTVAYPSGSTFTYGYNGSGYPAELRNGSTVLEEMLDTDAFGSPTETAFANGLTTVRGYDPSTGRITSIETGPIGLPTGIQDLEYQWRTNSTLYRRIDQRGTGGTTDDYTDTFAYDVLERLTSQVTSVGASRTLSFAYSSWGNLTGKTSNVGADLDVTGYTYGTAGKPHRLTAVTIGGVSNTLSYDANGNTTTYDAASGNDTFLVYDGQNRVTRITVGASSGTATPAARGEFWYDPDGQRFLGRESWDEAGVQKQVRTVYLANFEEVIPASGSAFNLVQRTDVSATVRHIRTRTTGGSIATRFEYVYRDHLGSVDVVTNSSGSKLEKKLSFDPFGGRREEAWGSDILAASMATILAKEDERYARGFTDHEMLNRTGFVHMNGRVYDPRLGRFVSPDPIVQFPTFSQSYNRYSYVLNSPLSYTDPSGFASRDKLNDPELAKMRQLVLQQELMTLQVAQTLSQFNHMRNRNWFPTFWAPGSSVPEEPKPKEVVDDSWAGVADTDSTLPQWGFVPGYGSFYLGGASSVAPGFGDSLVESAKENLRFGTTLKAAFGPGVGASSLFNLNGDTAVSVDYTKGVMFEGGIQIRGDVLRSGEIRGFYQSGEICLIGCIRGAWDYQGNFNVGTRIVVPFAVGGGISGGYVSSGREILDRISGE